MAWKLEKETGDLVWSGVETGIAPSPHKGTANIQNANISTETGEVMVSYARTQQSMTSTSTSGTLSFVDSSHVSLAITGSNNLFKGMWVTVTGTTHAGELANGTYWVTLSSGSNFQLSSTYNGSAITGFTAGLTATITLTRKLGVPVWYATEQYSTASAFYFRYYMLDDQGLVWVYDSQLASTSNNIAWFLPNTSITYFSGGTVPSGITVLNGWVLVFTGATIYCKPTVNLGGAWTAFSGAAMNNFATGPTPHFAYTGHQGKAYYCDGNYIGSIFPNTSLLTGAANIQSYAQYTASTTTGTFTAVISGSLPNNGLATGSGGIRIPAVFFTDAAGTQPTNLTAGTIYYIENNNGASTFQVFAADSGGAAINIATGAAGNQYYNTFFPTSAGGLAAITYTPQRLNLPEFEIAQCMTEVGNSIIVGGIGNAVYPWNQIDPTPSSIISLPENRTKNIITVNQMAYIFAGAKGNVYITDGSVASLVIKVPDYCAGTPGSPATYIEPFFKWGGAMYTRGRVYFGIEGLGNGATVGTCSGVWSFVPTQNLYVGQDTGLALRLENQNSYGTYDGLATVLIPAQPNLNSVNQGISPQYWSGWYSSEFNTSTNGIDFTSTSLAGTAIIETDIIPSGTVLDKKSFSQVEYKTSSPLAADESITLNYRVNQTAAFASAGTVTTESTTDIAGYTSGVTFQNTQWVQLQALLNSTTTGVRLTEIRLR